MPRVRSRQVAAGLRVRSHAGSRDALCPLPRRQSRYPGVDPGGRWRGSVSGPAWAVAMPRVRSRRAVMVPGPPARAVAVACASGQAGGGGAQGPVLRGRTGPGGRCRPGGPGASPGGPGRPRTRRCGRRSSRGRRCRSRRAAGGGRHQQAGKPCGQAGPVRPLAGEGFPWSRACPGCPGRAGRPGPRVHRPPRLRSGRRRAEEGGDVLGGRPLAAGKRAPAGRRCCRCSNTRTAPPG